MIETPRVVDSPALRTAIIHCTCALADIQDTMTEGIEELLNTLDEQGIKPAGPLLAHYLEIPGETFEFEITVPVSTPVTPQGRVVPSEMVSRRVLQTTLHGDYDGLGDAWGEFFEWIEANGIEVTDDFWECYAVGPETSDDPADWRTELNQPLAQQ